MGGQGIYIKYLSKALADLGHEVDVYSGQPYPELESNVNLVKVPSLNLYEHENHVFALRPRHFKSYSDVYEWWTMLTGGFAEPYTFCRRVEKLLNKKRYDIIHDNQSLGYGLLKLQKRHKNVVCTIHHPIHRDRELAIDAAKDNLFKVLAKRWYSFLSMQENVVKKLNHIVTVSETSQRDIAHYFRKSKADITVIPNGIDTHMFRPLPHIQKRPYRLISTASSDQPLKGLPVLLHAIHNLKNTLPDIELVIIGSLKKGGEAERLVKELNLEATVQFRSRLTSEELVEEYNQSLIAVCPSLYEGFGLPAAEAMACGLAIVSSNGGALPEVIGDAGVVVPAGNSEALEKAILHLIQNPKNIIQLNTQARKRILEKFCWSQVAIQLTDYYHTQVLKCDLNSSSELEPSNVNG